ncbi:hypothetical protein QL285_030307 [Trifolium repens]|nr:hypothetical protein QL285_030307 [Trifolium repens]
MMTVFLAYASSGDDTYSNDESPALTESYVDKVFHDWMLEHGRTYSNSTEMKKRREIFKKELEHIKMFNNDGKKSYKIGLNAFSDLTFEESFPCSCVTEDDEYDEDDEI